MAFSRTTACGDCFHVIEARNATLYLSAFNSLHYADRATFIDGLGDRARSNGCFGAQAQSNGECDFECDQFSPRSDNDKRGGRKSDIEPAF